MKLDGVGSKVVFFGAHTDDEMICAGTLHRLARTGADLHVVTFSPAATARDRTGSKSETSQIVMKEWENSLDLIGAPRDLGHRMFLDYRPSAELPKFRQDVCQFIFNFVSRVKPDMVLTLSPDDENPAHAMIGVESERVMRGRVPTVIRCLFPWNYTIGRPNLFVSLAPEDYEVKKKVIAAYESQKFRYSYEEMLTAFVVGDGLSVKVPMAEKFEIIRSVV